MNPGDLTGRTAIVTGGSRGIGIAAAAALADAGAHVVLTSRSQKSADAAADSVGERAVGFAAHSADEQAARRCIDYTLDTFGSIDILVNNAGTNPAFGPLIEQDYSRFAKTLEVNLWAPILWTSLAARAWMSEHGGAVVNTASVGAMMHEPGLGMYNASKAAIVHVTRQLAMELSPRIRVNAVAPGVVRTKLAEALWREHEPAVATATAVGRIGEPDDIAATIAFLAGDAASWITGAILVVDGGQSIADVSRFRPGADATRESALSIVPPHGQTPR
ncbi:SDR family oxidoreductase [Nocardia fluminea]|uniref:SDR family oxidoreductase n=1 Tax=Nocardia fluminea TaxID=134984 RepID=UPI003663B41D